MSHFIKHTKPGPCILGCCTKRRARQSPGAGDDTFLVSSVHYNTPTPSSYFSLVCYTSLLTLPSPWNATLHQQSNWLTISPPTFCRFLLFLVTPCYATFLPCYICNQIICRLAWLTVHLLDRERLSSSFVNDPSSSSSSGTEVVSRTNARNPSRNKINFILKPK